MSNKRKTVRISDIQIYSDMFHLSDAKLRTDDGCTFDVHRTILAVRSDFFRSMFCGKDRDKSEFLIPGVSGECLNNILCYLYSWDIQVSERNVRDLMIAADYLSLKDLRAVIKRSIKDKMTEFNCFEILNAAHQISDETIFQECFRFITTRFERLVRSQEDGLADLPLEVFRSVLSSRSLYVRDEATVWQAIVEWAQKDIPFRTCCVPPLLLTLAVEEVGEELATEILQHEIISENSLMKYLRSANDFTSNRDVLSSLLRSYSNPFTQPIGHRIPLTLHVISYYDEDGHVSNLHVTYDENLDLWRKVTGTSIGTDFLMSVGHNIYVFDMIASECMKFDLSSMEWVRMANFRNEYYGVEYCVLAIDAFIYILGKILGQRTYVGEVYDTANDRWFSAVPLPQICYGAFVAIEKNIYLVGHDQSVERMMTWMFDPVTQLWSIRPRPTVNRTDFALVAYHKKIYLIGGSTRNRDFSFSNVEVFDPSTNIWKDLPNLPYTYSHTYAKVFNDQILIYGFGGQRNKKSVRWNDATECWEDFDKNYNFHNWQFCSVDDVDTVRMITKQNRDPRTQMEKSIFI